MAEENMKNLNLKKLNRLNEIANMLDDDYQLVITTYKSKIKWYVYKKCPTYAKNFNEENETIMSSDKNTLDELYTFAFSVDKTDRAEKKVKRAIEYLADDLKSKADLIASGIKNVTEINISSTITPDKVFEWDIEEKITTDNYVNLMSFVKDDEETKN